MGKEKPGFFEISLKVILGLLAIVAVRSIFENDNSKIISKKGKSLLSDDQKMKDINEKILESESKNNHNEVYI